jgi:hypothetical protein
VAETSTHTFLLLGYQCSFALQEYFNNVLAHCGAGGGLLFKHATRRSTTSSVRGVEACLSVGVLFDSSDAGITLRRYAEASERICSR